MSRSTLRPRPWKNGSGRTWEVAAFPDGADFSGMLWRLSLAEVACDGPFSAFPGVDRTLTVISGAMTLDFGDGRAVALDPTSPPLSFPGEVAVHARVASGIVEDFNVMTRRGAVSHCVTACDMGSPAPVGTIATLARERTARLGGLVLAPGEILLANPGEDLAGLRADAPLLAVALVRH